MVVIVRRLWSYRVSVGVVGGSLRSVGVVGGSLRTLALLPLLHYFCFLATERGATQPSSATHSLQDLSTLPWA